MLNWYTYQCYFPVPIVLTSHRCRLHMDEMVFTGIMLRYGRCCFIFAFCRPRQMQSRTRKLLRPQRPPLLWMNDFLGDWGIDQDDEVELTEVVPPEKRWKRWNSNVRGFSQIFWWLKVCIRHILKGIRECCCEIPWVISMLCMFNLNNLT